MSPKPIRLGDRDLRMLEDLAEVGILDTATFWRRHFPDDRTGKACLRRLRLLTAHSLLSVIPVAVLCGPAGSGRPQRLFRLTERGAELLTTLRGMSPISVPRRDPRPETLQHRLGIAKLRLIVDDACALHGLPKPRWIGEYDAVAGVRRDATFAERFVLCETFPSADGGHVTCWPDASCRLRIPDLSVPQGVMHHLILYWEYDRSTEGLRQVARKVPGYAALLTSGGWQKHWHDAPGATVRVFVVVLSEERLRNVVLVIRECPGAESLRFAVESEITTKTFLTEPIWQTVQGERRTVLRIPVATRSDFLPRSQ